MSIAEFYGQLRVILNEYESQGRQPQRVLEMIACMVRECNGGDTNLPGPFAPIGLAVKVWERGDRPDLDALETIAALARQIQARPASAPDESVIRSRSGRAIQLTGYEPERSRHA
jgi:hypothetical protein